MRFLSYLFLSLISLFFCSIFFNFFVSSFYYFFNYIHIFHNLLLCRYRNICLLILIIFVFFYLFVTLYRNTNNNIHVSFIPFYCTLILTILTILTTCLFFPLSLFLILLFNYFAGIEIFIY